MHGGPGSPETGFFDRYNNKISEVCNICLLDQRGSGKSFKLFEKIKVEDMINDNMYVAKYLKKKFNTDKIILVGHSWGTYLGLLTINKYPDIFCEYIGISQISNQFQSEKEGYNKLLEIANKNNDKKNIELLKKYKFNDVKSLSSKYLNYRTNQLTAYGYGIMKDFDFKAHLKKEKNYSGLNKIKYILGMISSGNQLFLKIFDNDIINNVIKINIPITIVMGRDDYITSVNEAKKYFDKIQSNNKNFYIFDNSSHSPIFEEPLKFNELLKGIINETK